MLGFRRATVLESPDSVRRVAATGMVGRRDQANRATVPPAHIAMLTRLTRMEAKTRPARSGAMVVVRSRAISAEIARHQTPHTRVGPAHRVRLAYQAFQSCEARRRGR